MGESDKRWGSDEDQFLRENYDKMQYKEIAEILGRKEQAVKNRCSKLKLRKLPRREEIRVGDRFGRLLVIEIVKVPNRTYLETKFKCECDCQKDKSEEDKEYRIVCASNLRSGETVSCGCYMRENNGKHSTTHGLCKEYGRILQCLKNMHERCYNEKCIAYSDYGERDIGICDEWNIFKNGDQAKKNFVEWALNNGYADDLTIDKIDNFKWYSPTNAQWLDRQGQANNTRRNKKVKIFGEEKTIRNWIKDERCVVTDYRVLYNRIFDLEWEPERAITTPEKEDEKTSKYVGVSFAKTRNKWTAYLRINKEYVYLGEFDSEEKAAKVRDKYVLNNNLSNYHINFPENEKAPEENSPEA